MPDVVDWTLYQCDKCGSRWGYDGLYREPFTRCYSLKNGQDPFEMCKGQPVLSDSNYLLVGVL